MKTNVDLVNLIATQELPPPPSPLTVNDFINVWPVIGTPNRGYKYSINDLAALISSVLGSGSLLPERVYTIGVDMPIGSSLSGDRRQIIDPYLSGKVYTVHRRSVEWLTKGVEWDNTVVGGGIQLLQTDGVNFDTFNPGEVITVYFTPQFSPYIPTPDAIARFSDGENIFTASGTITAGMYRSIIRLRSSTDVLSVTIPSASDYPEDVLLCIVSDGGNHKQASLICNGSDVIIFNNTTWPVFYLNQNQQIFLVRGATAGTWIVANWSGSESFNRIGVVDFGYLKGANQIYATSDTPLLRAVYPGLWAWVKRLAANETNAVVSGASWADNKGLWGTGDGDLNTGTSFNAPNISGRFPRYVDPAKVIDKDRVTPLPGTFQSDAIKTHQIQIGSPGDLLVMRRVGSAGGFGLNPAPTGFERTLSSIITYNGNVNETRGYNIGGLPLINY